MTEKSDTLFQHFPSFNSQQGTVYRFDVTNFDRKEQLVTAIELRVQHSVPSQELKLVGGDLIYFQKDIENEVRHTLFNKINNYISYDHKKSFSGEYVCEASFNLPLIQSEELDRINDLKEMWSNSFHMKSKKYQQLKFNYEQLEKKLEIELNKRWYQRLYEWLWEPF